MDQEEATLSQLRFAQASSLRQSSSSNISFTPAGAQNFTVMPAVPVLGSSMQNLQIGSGPDIPDLAAVGNQPLPPISRMAPDAQTANKVFPNFVKSVQELQQNLPGRNFWSNPIGINENLTRNRKNPIIEDASNSRNPTDLEEKEEPNENEK